MKKLYIIPAALFMMQAISVHAQVVKPVSEKRISAIDQAWFCTAVAIQGINGGVGGDPNPFRLFPDTIGKITVNGGITVAPYHAIAEIMDPKHLGFIAKEPTAFIHLPNLPSSAVPDPQPYSCDSISVQYLYGRLTPSTNATYSAADTLIFSIASNEDTTNIRTNIFAGGGGISTNHASATHQASLGLQFYRPKYNYQTNDLVATGDVLRFKVHLTWADTTTTGFGKELKIKLPRRFFVPAGKFLIATMYFKPGYDYDRTTVIDTIRNVFVFYSYEENGLNTWPTYKDCKLYSKTECEFNTSLTLSTDIRYNISTNLNGAYFPPYNSTLEYGAERHIIQFKLATGFDPNIGVNELEKSSGIVLGQNFPNPFTKESTVSYQLTKNAASVIFSVTDVTGRIIASEKLGKTAGEYTVKLGSFASGLYYYSLIVDGYISTKKFIVE